LLSRTAQHITPIAGDSDSYNLKEFLGRDASLFCTQRAKSSFTELKLYSVTQEKRISNSANPRNETFGGNRYSA
jgi:hypothetical protein